MNRHDNPNPLANNVRSAIDRRASLTGEPNSEQRDVMAERERAQGNWRPIQTYDTKAGPDIVLLAYENGHVTVGEYLEHCDGGPDDHQTWDPYIAPKDAQGKSVGSDWWPTHWQPLPAPPQGAAAPVETNLHEWPDY